MSLISGALGAFNSIWHLTGYVCNSLLWNKVKYRYSAKKCLPHEISIMLTNLCWYLALRDCYVPRTKEINIKSVCSSGRRRRRRMSKKFVKYVNVNTTLSYLINLHWNHWRSFTEIPEAGLIIQIWTILVIFLSSARCLVADVVTARDGDINQVVLGGVTNSHSGAEL